MLRWSYLLLTPSLVTSPLEAVTPAWVENLKLAFYWGGLVLAWCSPVRFFLVVWAQPYRTQEKNTGMFPLNIHTSSVNTPTLTPTIVNTDLHPNVPERSTQRTLEDHHAGAQPRLEAPREGGCKGGRASDNPDNYLRGMIRILPGPSKVQGMHMANMSPSSA